MCQNLSLVFNIILSLRQDRTTQDIYLTNLKAISHYKDTELAVLVANKRVNDFKRSLRLRVTSDMDSLATQAWIEHQDLRNEGALEKIPNFEELFAQKSIPEVLERSVKD